eukprot:3684751-Pleurochrysis_carterae.AAC.2
MARSRDSRLTNLHGGRDRTFFSDLSDHSRNASYCHSLVYHMCRLNHPALELLMKPPFLDTNLRTDIRVPKLFYTAKSCSGLSVHA